MKEIEEKLVLNNVEWTVYVKNCPTQELNTTEKILNIPVCNNPNSTYENIKRGITEFYIKVFTLETKKMDISRVCDLFAKYGDSILSVSNSLMSKVYEDEIKQQQEAVAQQEDISTEVVENELVEDSEICLE